MEEGTAVGDKHGLIPFDTQEYIEKKRESSTKNLQFGKIQPNNKIFRR
jgi:hypothetical protein